MNGAALRRSRNKPGGAYEDREGRYQSGGQAERNGLRRMPGRGQMVVSSAPMRAMRAHRLLRQLTKPACVKALRRHGSSGHHELRAGRALVLRLSHRGILRRPKTSSAGLPSGRSAGAGTGRSGARKLASAASRVARRLFSPACKPRSLPQRPLTPSARSQMIYASRRFRRAKK
jgi:hypothetical protein